MPETRQVAVSRPALECNLACRALTVLGACGTKEQAAPAAPTLRDVQTDKGPVKVPAKAAKAAKVVCADFYGAFAVADPLWKQFPAVKAGRVFPVVNGTASLGTTLELIDVFDTKVLAKLVG
jgi:hypothetical protein